MSRFNSLDSELDSLLPLLQMYNAITRNRNNERRIPDRLRYQIEMMDHREQRCPCGCPGMQFHEERDAIKIKTKEKHGTNVFEDKVFGFEVLRFQGKHYCPEQVAPVWKKDCRMWLWKCPPPDKTKLTKRGEKGGC